MSVSNHVVQGRLSLLRNTVLVRNLESGQRKSKGGLVILDDNMKDVGIRPRWAQVYKIGPDVNDLNEGEWILIKHGRWTYGFDLEDPDTLEVFKVWRVEYPDSVELISPDFPSDLVPEELQK